MVMHAKIHPRWGCSQELMACVRKEEEELSLNYIYCLLLKNKNSHARKNPSPLGVLAGTDSLCTKRRKKINLFSLVFSL